MKSAKGFLLIEALIAILILSVVLVAALGGISQGLRLSSRAEETTKAVLAFESLLFELETGTRSDLVGFGGSGNLGEYSYHIESQSSDSENSSPSEAESDSDSDSDHEGPSFYQIKGRMDWKDGKENIALEAYLSQGAPG